MGHATLADPFVAAVPAVLLWRHPHPGRNRRLGLSRHRSDQTHVQGTAETVSVCAAGEVRAFTDRIRKDRNMFRHEDLCPDCITARIDESFLPEDWKGVIRIQWLRNAEGGQPFGNQQLIYTNWDGSYVSALRRDDEDWVVANVQDDLHGVLSPFMRSETLGIEPDPGCPLYAIEVQAFDSTDAHLWGTTADSDLYGLPDDEKDRVCPRLSASTRRELKLVPRRELIDRAVAAYRRRARTLTPSPEEPSLLYCEVVGDQIIVANSYRVLALYRIGQRRLVHLSDFRAKPTTGGGVAA